MLIDAHIFDVLNCRQYDGRITIDDGRIASIVPIPNLPADAPCVLPGFVDAHVHIESSMLLPSNFAPLAMKHGTVAAVCDPHEIANVLGVEGVNFMIEDSSQSPFCFCYAAPSCVPCTGFETSGASLGVDEVSQLLKRDDIYALAEMMNAPGVVFDDPVVLGKIAAAHQLHKPVDGHAPLLSGDGLKKYIQAGISTDHECTTLAEAEEKLTLGQYVLIREGSAAHDYDALSPLLQSHSDHLMFCSDDKHPDDLLDGHINLLVKRSLAAGYPLWNVLRAACVEPVLHYKIPVGLLQVGDSADFLVVDNLQNLNIRQLFIHGEDVLNAGCAPVSDSLLPNNFKVAPISVDDLRVAPSGGRMRVIVASNGSLLTDMQLVEPKVVDNNVVSDVPNDILKLVVVNRYSPDAPIQIAFIKGFNLNHGALASTIAHDSHNLIALGTSDDEIALTVNTLIREKGGIAVCSGSDVSSLPLPIAGLMSPLPGDVVASSYSRLNTAAHELGCPFDAPFMTLSFMALPVIPHLKITDKGLFNGSDFCFTTLFE